MEKPVKQKTELEELFDTPNTTSLTMFSIGYFIYSVAFVASMTTMVSYVVSQAIQVLGMVMFVIASMSLIKWRHDNLYLSKVYGFYMVWLLIVVLRGLSFSFDFIKLMLLMPGGGIFQYFAPLVMMFPVTPKALKKIFSLILVFGFTYGVFCMIFYEIVLYGSLGDRASTGIFEFFTQMLALSSGFYFMTFLYHKKKWNFFALGVTVFAFVMCAIRARRGSMFMCISMLLVGYILFLKFSRGSKMLNTFISVVMLFFVLLYAVSIFQSNKGGMFGLVVSRMDEDTRTGVEEAFYGSMDLPSWIFGRGSAGTYYCPGIDEGGEITIFRSTIETGYLQTILNGGLISLVLYVMIILPGAIKGLFKSKNLLCKACGIWIILFMIYSYPTVTQIFTLSYMIVWLSVGICYNDKIRNLTDDELRTEFFKNE